MMSITVEENTLGTIVLTLGTIVLMLGKGLPVVVLWAQLSTSNFVASC